MTTGNMDPKFRDACYETNEQVSTCFDDIVVYAPHTSEMLTLLVYASGAYASVGGGYQGGYGGDWVSDFDEGNCSTESFGFSNLEISVATDPFDPTPAPMLLPTPSTPVPTPVPAPTQNGHPWTVVVHEPPSDPNIGAGWSDTGVTNYSSYGFVHGNCAACDQSLGRYGLLHDPITKTYTGLSAHTHLRVSMRLWKLDWWDYYGIQCCSRQQGDNLFVEADGVTVFTTGVGTVVGPRTHFLRVTHAAQQGSRRGA